MVGHWTFVWLIYSIVWWSVNYLDKMTRYKRPGDFHAETSESPGPSCKKIPKRHVTKATFDIWQQDNDRNHSTIGKLLTAARVRNGIQNMNFMLQVHAFDYELNISHYTE